MAREQKWNCRFYDGVNHGGEAASLRGKRLNQAGDFLVEVWPAGEGWPLRVQLRPWPLVWLGLRAGLSGLFWPLVMWSRYARLRRQLQRNRKGNNPRSFQKWENRTR